MASKWACWARFGGCPSSLARQRGSPEGTGHDRRWSCRRRPWPPRGFEPSVTPWPREPAPPPEPCETDLLVDRFRRSFTALLASNGRVFGIFYVAGAAVGLSSLALPHGGHFNVLADLVISTVVLSIGLWAWQRRHVGQVATALLIGFGTLAVSGGIYSGRGDDVSMSAAVVYIWLALAAGLLSSAKAIVGHVCLIGAAYGLVLGLSGNSGAPAEWFFVTGTAGVTAAITYFSRSDLLRLSRVDPLTGTLNRAGLHSTLVRELAQARRTGRPLSLAVVDLDGFKELNDKLGHLAGDAALVHTVRAWQGALRTGDVLARFGGDEFVIALPGSTLLQARRVLRRLGRIEGACGWSAGLACWDWFEDPEQLLRRADKALYAAKARGRSGSVGLARTATPSPPPMLPDQLPRVVPPAEGSHLAT